MVTAPESLAGIGHIFVIHARSAICHFDAYAAGIRLETYKQSNRQFITRVAQRVVEQIA